MQSKQLNILLVDDDEVDVTIIKRDFKQKKIANPIYTASDGYVALNMLKNCEVPAPYIILLDLHMPKIDGFEFLKIIRADEELSDSEVIVLTSSDSDKNRVNSFGMNALGYIVKKDTASEFLRVVEKMTKYWKVVEMPL
ncbi:response regulator [Aliikangiella sp. IMCC44653]